MPAHKPETDFRTREEHQDANTSGSPKHLKSAVLGDAQRSEFGAHRLGGAPESLLNGGQHSCRRERHFAENRRHLQHAAGTLNGLALKRSAIFDAAMSRGNAMLIVTYITKSRPTGP
jgi:hypothetical protein